MLIAIRVTDNQLVFALDELKSNGPFLCPSCRSEVTLRLGRKTEPHFAHAPAECGNARNETQAHRSAKLNIYRALQTHPDVTDLSLEHHFGTVRADVFARINGVPVAIEMQISNLSPEAIAYRTEEYTRQGIHVLWLLLWTHRFDAPRYSPRPFERWLHALYFGQVYVWKSGRVILPFQFRDYGTIVLPRRWHTETGRIKGSHSYMRISKRHKVALQGKRLDMVSDFHPLTRTAWNSKTLSIPPARLFIGRKPLDLRARLKNHDSGEIRRVCGAGGV